MSPGYLFIRLDPGALHITTFNPLSSPAIAEILRGLGPLGAGSEIRPHGMRHAAITNALERTQGDVIAVQRFARLRDLNTIRIYDDRREDASLRVGTRLDVTGTASTTKR